MDIENIILSIQTLVSGIRKWSRNVKIPFSNILKRVIEIILNICWRIIIFMI